MNKNKVGFKGFIDAPESCGIYCTHEGKGSCEEQAVIDIWGAIEDEHYPECPTAIAARKKLKSTLCLCDNLEIAYKSARECLRCHNLAELCKCGAKAQLV